MKGKSKYPKTTLFLFVSINMMEFLIILTQGKDMFGHAFIDELGVLMMGGLAVVFILLLLKVGVSDVIRGVKRVRGNIEENKRKERKMEYAKMVREL